MRYTTKALLVCTAAIAVVFCFYPFASTVAALAPALILAICVSSHAAFRKHQLPVRTIFAGAKSGFITAIAYGGLFAIYELWSKWNWNTPLVADTLIWRIKETTVVLVQVVVVFGGLALAGGAMAGLVISQLAVLYKQAFPRSGASGEPIDEPKVAEKLQSVSADWFVESYCSAVGYVLCQRPVSTMTEPNREDYSVLRRFPEWRRALFGYSWMPVLANELSTSCSTGAEIVSYLGDDLFLIKKRQAIEQKQASECRDVRRTYRLAMWPNWRSVVLSATPNIAPWFEQEASQGWELLSHYTGAIFFFGTTI